VVTKKEEKIGRKIGVVVVLSSDADRSIEFAENM
jgi:hypothetical protein